MNNSQQLGIDNRLKNINIRNQWGARIIRDGILALDDHEFIYSSGCRMAIFNTATKAGSKIVLPHFNNTVSVLNISLSGDKKYVAACVKCVGAENKAICLVYEVRADHTARPRCIIYEPERKVHQITFIGSAFSADSRFLACNTSVGSLGILIYDWELEKLISTLPITTAITHVSFNPRNSTKLCVTGTSGVFQFWHYGPHSAHCAPIEGLTTNTTEYTCHAWIGSNANCVIAGTTRGDISLVIGCHQHQFISAFNSEIDDSSISVYTKVYKFIIHGTKLVCISPDNYVSIFEIKQAEKEKDEMYSLVLLNRFRFGKIASLYGIAWNVSNPKEFTVNVSSSTGIFQFDVKATDILSYDEEDSATRKKSGQLTGDKDDSDHNASAIGSLQRSKSSKGAPRVKTENNQRGPLKRDPEFRWGYLRPIRTLTRIHSGEITSLALSKRTSLFVTASLTDNTIRMWDYNMIRDSELVVDDFSDRGGEKSNTIDIHPSGLYLFSGSEDHAIEYGCTNSKFEVTRKIPIKIAVMSPTGEPFVNNAPVSLVKYSNGGHLIAVVTGRMVQVFHLYNLEFSSDKAGTPTRVMCLTEHSANVTDIEFSKDDFKLWTTSVDGSVYEWTFGKSNRDSDFVVKGIPAMMISCSPSGSTIISYFESVDDKKGRLMLNRRGSSGIPQGSERNLLVQPPFHGASSTSATVNALQPEIRKIGSRPSLAVSTMSSGKMASAISPHIMSTPGGTLKETQSSKKMFLVLFCNGHVRDTDSKILPVEVPITCMAFGTAEAPQDDRNKPGEMFVMGLADGRILISILPLPLREIMESPVSRHLIITTRSATVENIDKSTGDAAKGIANNPGEEGDKSVFSETRTRSNTMEDHNSNGSKSDAKNDADDDAVSITSIESFAKETKVTAMEGLDESKCRTIALHDGPVSRIRLAPTGSWIISAGIDGSIFMLSTTLRAKAFQFVPEAIAGDNTIMLTDRVLLIQNTGRIEQLEQHIADSDKQHSKDIEVIQGTMEREYAITTDHLKRELELRDELIIKGRDEQTRLCRIMQEEIDSLGSKHERNVSEIECTYEKQIAQHQAYMQNMKQAYDEQLVHARMDINDLKADAEKNMSKAMQGQEQVIAETDKQKAVLLQYCEYVSERNKDIFNELEHHHDTEKDRLLNDIKQKSNTIDEMKQKHRTDIAVSNRAIVAQRDQLHSKDMEILGQKQEIDTLMAKLNRLETSLQDATKEIQRRIEMAERWEYKSGVQQQQITELERVRKALTSQLHVLREKTGPQSEVLLKTEERLREVDTEYGQSLQDLSEKEAKLMHSGSVIQLMQKQLRELRSKLTRKEHSLTRAVAILHEFEICLQNAKFDNGRKATVKKKFSGDSESGRNNGFEIISDKGGSAGLGPRDGAEKQNTKWNSNTTVIDVFTSTPEMNHALQRLRDILTSSSAANETVALESKKPEDDDFVENQKVVNEQKRQMQLLENNIQTLKTSLKLTSSVCTKKVQTFLKDNDNLIDQVNRLRQELRNEHIENQRLKAKEVFDDAKKVARSEDVDYFIDDYDVKNYNDPSSSGRKEKTTKDGGNSSLLDESSYLEDSHSIPASARSGMVSMGSEDLYMASRNELVESILSVESKGDSVPSIISHKTDANRQAKKAAADKKIAEILASNQKLISELNLPGNRDDIKLSVPVLSKSASADTSKNPLTISVSILDEKPPKSAQSVDTHKLNLQSPARSNVSYHKKLKFEQPNSGPIKTAYRSSKSGGKIILPAVEGHTVSNK